MRALRALGMGIAAGAATCFLLHCSSDEATTTPAFPVVDATSSSDGAGAADAMTADTAVDAGPKEGCTTVSDDDKDGLWQCDDGDCAGNAACDPGTTPTGGQCTASSDCAATNGKPLCVREGYKLGYCSQFCSLSKQDCPSDSRCVRNNANALAGKGDRGYCFRSCDRAALDAGDASAGCPPTRTCFTNNLCIGE